MGAHAPQTVDRIESAGSANSYVDVNRRAWDLRTAVHVDSGFYDVAGFLGGKLTLRPPELELVGDVAGLSLLHLQCHFGLDTLSWRRLGARPTGVDFSPASVETARRLAARTQLDATFVEADVQTLGDRFGGAFNLVVTTYGVLCWLHDMRGWADGIRGSLRPGGRLVLVEFHPVLDLLYKGAVSGCDAYFGSAAAERTRTSGTYTDPAAPISYEEYRWQHPISEVLTALLESGLHVSRFAEYPCCSFNLFPGLSQAREGMWYPSREHSGKVPYMYAVVAEAR